MSFGATKYRKGTSEYDIVTRLYDYIRVGVPHCESEHSRCEEGARFVRGMQWAEGDALRQEERDLPALNLNSIHKLVNAVANREIMNRIVPKVYGRNEEDHGTAEVLDMADKWQRSLAETEHEESMAFRASSSVGYGVMHKWWNPVAMDGEGAICDEEIPVWYMLWDPASRKQNLVDRKWHLCGKFVDYDEAKETFGDVNKEAKKKFKELDRLRFDGIEDETLTRVIPTGTGTWGQILGNRWFSATGKEVFVIEAEWREVEGFWKVAVPNRLNDWAELNNNPQSQVMIPQPGPDGQMQEVPLTGEQFQQMDDTQKRNIMLTLLSDTTVTKFRERSNWQDIQEMYESLTGMPFEDFRKERREVTKFAIMIDGTILDQGVRPIGYTYEFLTGFPFETRDGIEFYGMVDVAKGPQDFKNVFYSNLLKYYMTSPKQHLIIEEGAVHDVNDFLDQYAGVTGVSFVPDGFITQERFKTLTAPAFPPMIGELIRITEGAVQDIFGLSSIEMNTQGDLRRISGNVVSEAKAASNTLLAILFDSLRRYRRRWGLMSVKYITEMYQPGELIKIVGNTRAQYLEGIEAVGEMNQWPDMIRFDIKIDEAPSSITEQMDTVDYLTRTGTLDKWVDKGLLPFDNALDMLVTLPQSLRDQIKAARAQDQQVQQQMQQMQQQVQEISRSQELLRKFVASNPGGSQILAQFDYVENMARKMASEMQTQEQPTEGQGEPEGV